MSARRRIRRPARIGRRGAALAAVLVACALVLAGCSSPTGTPGTAAATPDPSGSPSPAPSASPSPTAAPAKCANPVASYAPQGALPAPGKMPAGSTMAKIQKNGRLVAGVSGDTRLFGASNTLDAGAPIQGFDIEVLKQISTAIFGSPDRITYKVITAANRIPELKSGGVDIVARNMTITCARWNDIAFSAEYYHAGQKVLVPLGSGWKQISDLEGKKVCAPKGSTSIANLEKFPGITPVEAERHTDCLVQFQQGTVDAITGDDVILAGFADQDPFADVVGPAFSDEPYGLGIKKENVDFVRFVNAVLERMKADGSWAAAYREWLQPSLKLPAPKPPTPDYGRR